jgi:dihydroorotate dehydrogenase electron transfer subunit
MPVDVDAKVLANNRLSDDYNVLALAAPEIAARVQPGQFVMLKPGRGVEPLLRRPFSVFEVLRDIEGEAVGISILNKRIGIGTSLLFDAELGLPVSCLGPLGRPFTLPDRPQEAWLIAGGVGLAPFATTAERLVASSCRTTLFYGARRADDLHYADWFTTRGVNVVVATEDGSAGVRGFVTTPLTEALAHRTSTAPLSLYACGPTPMMRAVADVAARFGHDVEVSLEQTMGCGLGGCYSCVVRVRADGKPPHFVRSCLAGPTFSARTVVWEELTH